MEDRLDRALAGWAGANGPSEQERERTRVTILLTPQVDVLWWERLDRQLTRFTAMGPLAPMGPSVRSGTLSGASGPRGERNT